MSNNNGKNRPITLMGSMFWTGPLACLITVTLVWNTGATGDINCQFKRFLFGWTFRQFSQRRMMCK